MIHMEYYLVVSTFMMFAGIYGFFTRRNLLAMLISVETDTEFGRHQTSPYSTDTSFPRNWKAFFSPCLLSA